MSSAVGNMRYSLGNFERSRGAVTIAVIAHLKGWVEERVGVYPALFMQHIDGKNECFLRLPTDCGIVSAPVSKILRLHSLSPNALKRRVLSLFEPLERLA